MGSMRLSGAGAPRTCSASLTMARPRRRPARRDRSCLAPRRNRRDSKYEACHRSIRPPLRLRARLRLPSRCHHRLLCPKRRRSPSHRVPFHRKTTISSAFAPLQMIPTRGPGPLPAERGRNVAALRPCDSLVSEPHPTPTSACGSARSVGWARFADRRPPPPSCVCSTIPILPWPSAYAWRSDAPRGSPWETTRSVGGSGQLRRVHRRNDSESRSEPGLAGYHRSETTPP